MEGGEVADAIVDSGILRSLLRLLRDPLSTLPLRLHLIDLIEKLMVEPAACRFLSSAVPGQDDVAPSEWDSFADLFIAIVTRIPMPNMFLDSVGMVLQKLAVYEALKRLAELSDCEEAPAEAAEGALDEIVEW